MTATPTPEFDFPVLPTIANPFPDSEVLVDPDTDTVDDCDDLEKQIADALAILNAILDALNA